MNIKTRKKVIQIMREKKVFSPRRISKKLNLSVYEIKNIVADLHREGDIEKYTTYFWRWTDEPNNHSISNFKEV